MWAAKYQKACEKALESGGGHKKEALHQLQGILTKRNEDWKLPGNDDLYVDVKAQIYRPAHMIANELGMYYNVKGESTRDTTLRLVERKKMSLETANIFMQVLEDYAKVTTAHQLQRGGRNIGCGCGRCGRRILMAKRSSRFRSRRRVKSPSAKLPRALRSCGGWPTYLLRKRIKSSRHESVIPSPAISLLWNTPDRRAPGAP